MRSEATPGRTIKVNKRARSGSTTKRVSKRAGSNNGAKTTDIRKSNTTETVTNGNVGGKINGLRLFSKLVCDKLEEKKNTTYNEVADELVAETMAQREEESMAKMGDDSSGTTNSITGKRKRGGVCHDEKNIRRRVYDALNVLDALEIITKDKKEIQWNGLPTRACIDLKKMQQERNQCLAEVEKKRELLQDLIVQSICFRNLAKRNERDTNQQQIARNALGVSRDDDIIPLPFIIVSTSSKATVQVDINDDQTELICNFDKSFEMSDNSEILKRLGFDKTTRKDLSKILPSELLTYCNIHNMLDSIIVPASKLPHSSYHLHHQQLHQAARAAAYSIVPQHPRADY